MKNPDQPRYPDCNEYNAFVYLSKRFASTLSSILVPPSPKNGRILILFIGTLFLFRLIKLFGCQFFSSSFIRYDTPMNFVILVSRIDSQGLPRSNDAIMQCIHDMKNFGFSERHFARHFRLIIIEVGPDVKWISALVLHHCVILGFAILRHQIDSIL